MRKFLKMLAKIVAYTAGGLIILLAIAIGLFRLLLPRLPEYQDDIKEWASTAIGLSVEFSGMDARWGFNGPEIEFYDAELVSDDNYDNLARIIAAEEVSVGVGLMQLLFKGKPVVDRVSVRDTTLEVRQQADGEWWIQGKPINELVPERAGNTGTGTSPIEIVGENIRIQFLRPGDERPKKFKVSSFVVKRDEKRIAVEADIDLPNDLGRHVTVSATQLLTDPASERVWNVTVEASDIELAGVTALQPIDAARFDSGSGDIELSLEFAGNRVQKATANIDVDDISIAGLSDLAVSGRLEFLLDADGWLIAADNFSAVTPAGDWPASDLRFEASTDSDGKIVTVDARASYLNFADVAVAEPWLNEQQRALLAEFEPSGVLRDLAVTLSKLDSDVPDFRITADLSNLGIAANGKRPGVRGFSGSLRADSSGGRLEVQTDELVVTAPGILGEPLALDTTSGTVIWRRSNNRTTILSDSIVISNEFFASETSIEVSMLDDGTAPFIDLDSTFSVSDISAVGRFVPFMAKRPKMSIWFQEGLISGIVPRGTAHLRGPLDKFPFEGDEGRLYVEGNIRDAVIIYQPLWPAARIINADIAVENMRLISERSHVINAGNEIINARLEIANFRQPELTISAHSTGTLESLRQLSIQSPIGEMLGGQLDRVTVNGDASVDLDLTIPIRDWESFEFTARVHSSDGSLQFEGFDAPLTNFGGIVTIERDDISSESLGGQFLGQPVSIELTQAPDTMPKYRVIANATGAATAEALISELGLPLENRVSGQANYAATLLFPRGDVDDPLPFAVEVKSDLAGFAVDLPQPLDKPLYNTIELSTTIFLPNGGERIESTGMAGDLLSWQVAFIKSEQQWDLDRGVLSFGNTPEIEGVPDTRGLHLRGNADYVRVLDWFEMSRDRNTKVGVAERIRSIDMTVKNLHVLGQHLIDHRIRVDRSARDWLVQLEGEDIIGSAFVPYDLTSGRAIVVDADRLVLPGDEQQLEEVRDQVDPRSLPPITMNIKELAFGKRHFGAVEATFARTADGLESEAIIAKDETFEIVGNGGWILDEADPEGFRSYVNMSLTSTDVERTMQRLDYDPGIVSNDLAMVLEMSWSGGPRDDLLEFLDGEVRLRIGKGQLAEVKPGAGRVFGLLSIAALPRRLALDFRDVFGKGFVFDRIAGTFRIVDGDTYTCDLLLESPGANIGIVGRAGLVTRDYAQTAVVSASFGNALPLAGALVAGPQVAAALLIFSRIFKKPLQEVTQVYYDIGGSWDEPVIESATAEIFALNGEASGCLAESE
jgi:uncharacterized protein (TIGR02099 family)